MGDQVWQAEAIAGIGRLTEALKRTADALASGDDESVMARLREAAVHSDWASHHLGKASRLASPERTDEHDS